MATTQKNLVAASGFLVVSLTSWSGDAVFPSQAVAGNQIHGPDTLTINQDGTISGPDGSYTIVKINDVSVAESITYSIQNAQVPQGTISISNIQVTTSTATITFSYDDTDQNSFEYRIDGGSWAAITSGQVISGLSPDNLYTIEVRAINDTGGGTPAIQNFSTNATSGTTESDIDFLAGPGLTTVSLGASPLQTYFSGFAIPPVENDQITTNDSDGVFDSSGNFSASTGGDYTVYHTRFNTGIIAAETVSISTTVDDNTPEPGQTVTFSIGGKVGPFTATYKGNALTIQSQTQTEVVVVWPDLQTFGDLTAEYNVAYDVVITDTDDSSTITESVTTIPKSGYDYLSVTGFPWDDSSIFDNDTSLDNGNYVYGYFSSGSGSINSEGVISGAVDRSVYTYWIFDGTTWGSSAQETFHVLGPYATTPMELVPNSETTSSVELQFQADVSGTCRIIGVPATDPAPSLTQRSLGQNSFNLPALGDSGSIAYSANTLTNITMNSLTNGSNFSFYSVYIDSLGRMSGDGPVNASTDFSSGPPITVGTIPDQSWSDGDVVLLDFKPYFSKYLSFSISGLAQNSGLTLDPSTGVLTGTVNLNDASGGDGYTVNRELTVTAINGSGTVFSVFSAGFYNRFLPTILSNIPDQSWSPESPLTLNLSSYVLGESSFELQIDNGSGYVDADSTLTTYGVAFDSSTGIFSGTLNNQALAVSPFSFRVRAVNDEGVGPWDEFVATIYSGQPPIFSGPIDPVSVYTDVPFTVDLGVYFSLASSYAISTYPEWSNISINSAGIISGLPSSDDSDLSPVTVTVTAINANGSTSGAVIINIVSLTGTSGTVISPPSRTVKVQSKLPSSDKVWPSIDLADRLDYAWDLTTWLNSDTIESASVAVGIEIVDALIFESNSFQLWINPNKPGSTAKFGEATRVTARIVTTDGREIEISSQFSFVDK